MALRGSPTGFHQHLCRPLQTERWGPPSGEGSPMWTLPCLGGTEKRGRTGLLSKAGCLQGGGGVSGPRVVARRWGGASTCGPFSTPWLSSGDKWQYLGVPAASPSVGARPGLLLNVPQCRGQTPSKRIPGPQTPVTPGHKDPALRRVQLPLRASAGAAEAPEHMGGPGFRSRTRSPTDSLPRCHLPSWGAGRERRRGWGRGARSGEQGQSGFPPSTENPQLPPGRDLRLGHLWSNRKT